MVGAEHPLLVRQQVLEESQCLGHLTEPTGPERDIVPGPQSVGVVRAEYPLLVRQQVPVQAQSFSRVTNETQPPQDGREGITVEHLPGNATAADVGQWMAGCLERDGHLDQRDVAHGLAGRFGDRFTYVTDKGHLAISERVLRVFRKAADGPQWDQRSLCWLPQAESGT